MMQRTFWVGHEGTHYPTDEQSEAALARELHDEGLKVNGEVEFFVVENTSNGPSKVRATFETHARTTTKTIGGKKAPDDKPKDDDTSE